MVANVYRRSWNLICSSPASFKRYTTESGWYGLSGYFWCSSPSKVTASCRGKIIRMEFIVFCQITVKRQVLVGLVIRHLPPVPPWIHCDKPSAKICPRRDFFSCRYRSRSQQVQKLTSVRSNSLSAATIR